MDQKSGNTAVHMMAATVTGLLVLAVAGCEQGFAIERAAAQICAETPPAAIAYEGTDAASATRDIGLLIKVKSALLDEPGLRAFPIDVGVAGGIVTLYGAVDTVERRVRAAQLAQSIEGVQTVNSAIKIVRET
jgi:hypothetical protein